MSQDAASSDTGKIDLKKQLRHLYAPLAKEVSMVTVPAMSFLMIDGALMMATLVKGVAMIIFTSQAPILGVTFLVMFLVALFEMVGLMARRNIAILSVVSLFCLGAAVLAPDSTSGLIALVSTAGPVLAIILALYALVTALRGRQWAWFVGPSSLSSSRWAPRWSFATHRHNRTPRARVLC